MKKLEQIQKRIDELGGIEYLQDVLERVLHLGKGVESAEDGAIINEALEIFEAIAEVEKEMEQGETVKIPRTKQPEYFLSAKAKVPNTLFKNNLPCDGEERVVGVERKSKAPIDTMVTVNFEKLPNVLMSRELSIYDRIIHDSITSLYVDGENEYITPLMIYRAMTGNPKAAPKEEQLERIKESVQLLSRIRIVINAEDEQPLFGLEKASYEGNLIASEIVTGEHNGRTDQWIHLLRSPILYEYSKERTKPQVSRTDIKLLNTPINKNVEKMELQYYLLQRVETIKNSRAKTSNRILFESIYEVLKIEAKSASSLRNKQSKIREAAFTILDYWVENKFIKNYKEVKKGKSITAIDIIT